VEIFCLDSLKVRYCKSAQITKCQKWWSFKGEVSKKHFKNDINREKLQQIAE